MTKNICGLLDLYLNLMSPPCCMHLLFVFYITACDMVELKWLQHLKTDIKIMKFDCYIHPSNVLEN